MSRGTAALTLAVTSQPVATPPESIFSESRLNIFGPISFCGYLKSLCPNRVHKKYSGAHIKIHSGSSFP